MSPLHRVVAAAFVASMLGVLTASGALGHGAIRDSSPAAGTVVTKAPKEVTLILAEPAGPGSTLVVLDGCGVEVSRGESIQRELYSTAIDGGQPGTWKVRMRSISAVDGHAVTAQFSFKVAGSNDCTSAFDAADDAITSSRPPIDNPDDGGTSFPIAAFAAGTLIVVGLALAIRRPWSRS